jgi:hypothetical protein
MKNQYLTLLLSIATLSASAQLPQGGTPYEWEVKSAPQAERILLPAPNLKPLRDEDALNDLFKEKPYRFGALIPVDLGTDSHGTWTTLPTGDRLWRLAIEMPGARSINFEFDVFMVPEGGQVFIYDPAKTSYLGSFTQENASESNSLGVGLFMGDHIILEYFEPAAVAGQGVLHIDRMNYGYRSPFGESQEKAGPFGNSGPCNININCPEGLPYQIQSRSVAIIVVGTSGICTGSLVNNTAQNNMPYFLTARHCLPPGGSNVNNWVFYFNHESPTCQGNTGPTNQSISGASLLAQSQESDFALLQLSSTPPSSFNVCYNGWDVTDSPSMVSSAYGIHHPRGDVKKICFENDAPFHQNMNTFVNQTWYINQWELGVTENGSSGSPLFSQWGLMIGVLSGGLAACAGSVNNGQYDFYGRLGVAWNFGNTPQTRLRDWLDPVNTGTLVMPNSCFNPTIQPTIQNDITLGTIQNVPANLCAPQTVTPSMTVINTGAAAVTSFEISVSFNGGPATNITWSGNLPSFNSVNLSLGEFTLSGGNNTIVATVASVNGSQDQNSSGNVAMASSLVMPDAQFVIVTFNFDQFPQETSWEIADPAGNVIYSGGPYAAGTTVFNQSYCLSANTCYTFTVFDSWGDGMCCQYGEGSYTVSWNGQVLASGSQFTNQQSTQICLGPLSNADSVRHSITLYPNPATEELRVDLGDFASELTEVRIFDLSGRVVLTFRGGSAGDEPLALPIRALAAGIYVVEVRSAGQQLTQKLVKY